MDLRCIMLKGRIQIQKAYYIYYIFHLYDIWKSKTLNIKKQTWGFQGLWWEVVICGCESWTINKAEH